jgi:hypothetical protein
VSVRELSRSSEGSFTDSGFVIRATRLPVKADIRQAIGKKVGETAKVLLEERIEN